MITGTQSNVYSSFQPSPFFVLDEVDAALDNTNVAKVANYIRQHASETFQFIVISLKGSLYEKGNSLVGIYRDQDVNSSRTLTLDVSNTNNILLFDTNFLPVEPICRLILFGLSDYPMFSLSSGYPAVSDYFIYRVPPKPRSIHLSVKEKASIKIFYNELY